MVVVWLLEREDVRNQFRIQNNPHAFISLNKYTYSSLYGSIVYNFNSEGFWYNKNDNSNTWTNYKTINTCNSNPLQTHNRNTGLVSLATFTPDDSTFAQTDSQKSDLMCYRVNKSIYYNNNTLSYFIHCSN